MCETRYLHIPDVKRLTLADEERPDESWGDVSRGVHSAVIQVGQAPRVRVQRLVFHNHFPLIAVRLSWLNGVGLIAWK